MTRDRPNSQRPSRGARGRAAGESLRERIVQVIERHHGEYDQWPTYREIGAAVGIASTSHVSHHVAMLVKQGILTRQPGISRGVALAHHNPAPRASSATVLLRGRIAAHEPLDLFDPGEAEEIDLGIGGFEMASGPADEQVYALQVDGDSMIEDGILDGDLVLVRPAVSAPDGAIAVVVERRANGGQGAATLKHIHKEADQVRLEPANPEHRPIIVSRDAWDRDWQVQGTAIGVYRPLSRRR